MNIKDRIAGGSADKRQMHGLAIRMRRLLPHYVVMALVGLFLLAHCPAFAYQQYQKYSQQVSGQYTDCAMCHRNHDGPAGIRPGQIGGLTPEQKLRYQAAQDALDPGETIDSPILNEFGNHIIKVLGRVQYIEMAKHPEQLPGALGFVSDLDGDGIPDAREFLQGTNPLDAQSGKPWTLLRINLMRNHFDILMILLVTIFGMYGLNNLFNGFARVVDAAGQQQKSEKPK